MHSSLRFLVVLIALVTVGCSEHIPPATAPGGDGPPAPYDGPELSSEIRILNSAGTSNRFEYIGNTFILDGTTVWGEQQFAASSFMVSTYVGDWYNGIVVEEGIPLIGGYSIAGSIPHEYWSNENDGIFATHMILVSDENQAFIWQWPSNMGDLTSLMIRVQNASSHATRLGLVGTQTSFSTYPAALEQDGDFYRLSLQALPGDYKLAVVDLDDGHDLRDSVTVWVEDVELIHWVEDFTHPRQPDVHRYFRYHVDNNGGVTSLGDENRQVYNNVVRVVNLFVEPTETVYLRSLGLTNDEPMVMNYIGNHTWELHGLTTWVGAQDLQVYTSSSKRVFRTVELNGQVLVHLGVLDQGLDPPVQLFKCFLHHNKYVEQGEDNRTADIGVTG